MGKSEFSSNVLSMEVLMKSIQPLSPKAPNSGSIMTSWLVLVPIQFETFEVSSKYAPLHPVPKKQTKTYSRYHATSQTLSVYFSWPRSE